MHHTHVVLVPGPVAPGEGAGGEDVGEPYPRTLGVGAQQLLQLDRATWLVATVTRTRDETRVTCSLLTAVCSSLVVTEASTAAWAAHLAAASSQLARPAPSRQHLAPTCRCRVYSGTAPGTWHLTWVYPASQVAGRGGWALVHWPGLASPQLTAGQTSPVRPQVRVQLPEPGTVRRMCSGWRQYLVYTFSVGAVRPALRGGLGAAAQEESRVSAAAWATSRRYPLLFTATRVTLDT